MTPRASSSGARIRTLVLALACAALSACTQGSAEPLAGWNLIVINIDALRADHLGFQGYARPTSPFLDKIAAEAVVFENSMAPSSFTRGSVAGLLTGRFPLRAGAFGWEGGPGKDSPHLGEILQTAGYRTAFLSNTGMLRSPAFTRGFETIEHLPVAWDVSGAGPKLTKAALNFVALAPERPFGLYLHYLDPHGPYEPAPKFRARMETPVSADPLHLYKEAMPELEMLVDTGFGPGDARYEDLVARYDAEIAATDTALEALFAGLGDLGVLGRTLVVVTSDHGEEFLEHGGLDHGWTLYQESIHVPLVFWAGAGLEPTRVATRVSQVDVLPSVAALLGLPLPEGVTDGVPLFDTSGAATAEERPIFVELLLPFHRNVVRAVLDGDWKYVAAHRWIEPYARHVAPAREIVDFREPPILEALYHLGEDPAELHDRSAAHPERAAALSAKLRLLGGAPAAPTERVEVDPKQAAQLRALGYLEARDQAPTPTHAVRGTEQERRSPSP